jgi:formylglycine-generating enzyme required for sulfatase activity
MLRFARGLIWVGLCWCAVLLSTGGTSGADAFARAQSLTPHGLAALLDGTGFVRIPAGEFLMGSESGIAAERPVHQVRISKAFEMGRFEVTQGQWVAVMGSAHSTPESGKATKLEAPTDSNPSHFKDLSSPVEKVSWNEVQQFLTTLNRRDPTHAYRLPTEAEWEYAARAGEPTDAPRDLHRIAWFTSNSDGRTHHAGRKEANAWGLHDVHGNVAEWVSDWYGFDYYEHSPAVDPQGPESGSYRVFRGCSWLGPASDCRAALRTFNFPGDGLYNVGFRLVRTAK